MSDYDRRAKARGGTGAGTGPCPGCGRPPQAGQDLVLVEAFGLRPVWWHAACRADVLAGTRPYRGQQEVSDEDR